MRTIDLILLWVATVGQVLFVLLWMTQRWWASTVGQALMAKSFSLMLLLVASVWSYYRGPIPSWTGRGLFGFIAVAIVAQLIALSVEVYRAHRDNRRVYGTNGGHSTE